MALPPPNQIALARRYGQQYGVDPRLLLAIGGHETQWGTTGAGRPSQGGFALGYGVTDSGILGKYHGLRNQYMYGAKTLADWGVHSLADVMAGKAARWATDPAWEKGVQSVYGGLPGSLPAAPPVPSDLRVPQGRSRATGPLRMQTKTLLAPQTIRQFDPGMLSQGIFSSLAQGGTPDIASLVAQSYKNVTLPGVTKRVPIGGTIRSKGGDKHVEGAPVPATSVGVGNLAATAKAQLGQKYVWGAESRKEGGFDCSGLVDWSLRQNGYKGPRVTTYTLKNMGQSVKGGALRPGDVVLCNNYDHVVIYAGNGKVIAAPHTGTVVQYQPLSQFQVDDVRRI